MSLGAEPEGGAAAPSPAVQAQGVRKAFRGVVALDDVTLDVPVGSTFMLLGPNGSGKTTFLRLVAGAQRPSRGMVRVLGVDPYRDPRALAQSVGIAYEIHFLPPWASARAYLRFAATARGFAKDIVAETAGRFGLEGYWDRAMGTYSAGMRKRVALAQACLGDPVLLVLDEPFSALDPEGRRLVSGLLRERRSAGRTTLLATHLAESGAPPTNLAVLLNGVVEAAGTAREVADRFGSRSVALEIDDPGAALRVLLAAGVDAVRQDDEVRLPKPAPAAVEEAVRALASAGIPVLGTEDRFDLWAIYRSVLVGETAGPVVRADGPNSSSDLP